MCQLLEVENQKVKKCTPRVWQRVGRRKKSKIALLRFLAVNPPPTLAAPNPLAWALFLFKMHLGAGNANWTGWVLLGKWPDFIAPVLVFRFWLNYRWHSQGLMLSSVEMRINVKDIMDFCDIMEYVLHGTIYWNWWYFILNVDSEHLMMLMVSMISWNPCWNWKGLLNQLKCLNSKILVMLMMMQNTDNAKSWWRLWYHGKLIRACVSTRQTFCPPLSRGPTTAQGPEYLAIIIIILTIIIIIIIVIIMSILPSYCRSIWRTNKSSFNDKNQNVKTNSPVQLNYIKANIK